MSLIVTVIVTELLAITRKTLVATKAIDLCFKLSNSLTSVIILQVVKGVPMIVNRCVWT